MGCEERLGSIDSDGVIEGSMDRVSDGLGANDTDGDSEGATDGVSLGATDTVGLDEGAAEGDLVGGSVFKIQRAERYSESSSRVKACKGRTPRYFAGLLSMIHLSAFIAFEKGMDSASEKVRMVHDGKQRWRS